MEKYLPFAALALTMISLAFAQLKTRAYSELAERCTKLETKLEFLVQFAFKNAILEFHSPDPQHKAADQAIERLVEGEELSAEEIDTLTRRIQTVAKTAEDKKRRLQATTTLVLMDEFMEAVTGRKYTAFSDFE